MTAYLALIATLYAGAAMLVLAGALTLSALGATMPGIATLARWTGWVAVAILTVSIISVRL